MNSPDEVIYKVWGLEWSRAQELLTLGSWGTPPSWPVNMFINPETLQIIGHWWLTNSVSSPLSLPWRERSGHESFNPLIMPWSFWWQALIFNLFRGPQPPFILLTSKKTLITPEMPRILITLVSITGDWDQIL